jgi:hypothetical protein
MSAPQSDEIELRAIALGYRLLLFKNQLSDGRILADVGAVAMEPSSSQPIKEFKVNARRGCSKGI